MFLNLKRRDIQLVKIHVFIQFTSNINVCFMNKLLNLWNGYHYFLLLASNPHACQYFKLNNMDTRNQIVTISATTLFNNSFFFLVDNARVPTRHTGYKILKCHQVFVHFVIFFTQFQRFIKNAFVSFDNKRG